MSFFQPSRHILLTGAGFTKNFNGYLAEEMWAAILRQPEVRGNHKLRRALLDCMNFEEVYDRIVTSEDYAEERPSFVTAVRRAYEQMHERICSAELKIGPSAAQACRLILSAFAGRARERGFFFTLNQDLFVEHFYSTSDCPPLFLPGLNCPRWFNRRLGPTLDAETRVTLPDEQGTNQIRERFWDKRQGSFAYIKLHGSLGWVGHSGDHVMVLGQTKSRLIKQEPLLRWYLSLFKEVLQRPDRYLVTIGYGFRDSHINDIIADAVRDHGLRLCVITPEPAARFRHRLQFSPSALEMDLTHRGDEIWPGLFYYGQMSLTELYDSGSAVLPSRGQEFFRGIELKL
jgi:hypothetical protein